VDTTEYDEYLDDLPYYLGDISRDEVDKYLKEIKQVIH
jgi:hypothetical protein